MRFDKVKELAELLVGNFVVIVIVDLIEQFLVSDNKKNVSAREAEKCEGKIRI